MQVVQKSTMEYSDLESITWDTTHIDGFEFQIIRRVKDNSRLGLVRKLSGQYEATATARLYAPSISQLFDRLELALNFLVIYSKTTELLEQNPPSYAA